MGYSVLTASDGVEALDERHEEALDEPGPVLRRALAQHPEHRRLEPPEVHRREVVGLERHGRLVAVHAANAVAGRQNPARIVHPLIEPPAVAVPVAAATSTCRQPRRIRNAGKDRPTRIASTSGRCPGPLTFRSPPAARPARRGRRGPRGRGRAGEDVKNDSLIVPPGAASGRIPAR